MTRWRAAALAGAVVVAATGCGTRLPPSAFPAPSATAPVTPSGLPNGQGNFGSDVGVTSSRIEVGILNSKTNLFDPRAFVGMYYGAKSYFDTLNAAGGVHGRLVHIDFCDDQGQGPANVDCVARLLHTDHVFAMAANAVVAYSGAAQVDTAGVPDVAGQPVDVAYDTYPHLFSLYGSQYPRRGNKPGVNGQDYAGTEVYRYFAVRFPKTPRIAAVVYYNQAVSQRFAVATERGLRAEGYRVYAEPINFALPDYNSAVLDMKQHHVQYVYDVLDPGGNENLCTAMDSNQLSVQAKVTTDENWVASITSDYPHAPHCRNSLYAFGDTVNYEDVGIPAVAQFRAAVHREHLDGPQQLSEWELDGWAAAQWLTDAMASCGAELTRRCVLDWMAAIPASGYGGHGLLSAPDRNFIPWRGPPPAHVFNCTGIARWQDSAAGGSGGWITQPVVGTNVGGFSCFTVYNLPYPAT